jgi:pimeloyl-ACP methyl ester carboxylesterase
MVCAVRGARGNGRKIALAGLLTGAAIGVVQRAEEAGETVPDEDFRADGLRGRPVTVTTDDGVRLAAEVVESVSLIDRDPGDHDAVAVVFAHGWMLNRHSWQFQRDALAGAATLVLYDQRGHGGSAPGAYDANTVERLGDDLGAVIEQTVPAGVPVVLVGHSTGSMTIMSLAARRPDLFGARVVGAALLSTSSGPLGDGAAEPPRPAGAPILQMFPDRMRAIGDLIDRRAVVRTRPPARRTMTAARVAALGPRAKREHIRFVNDMVEATPAAVMVGSFHESLTHAGPAAWAGLRSVETMILVGSEDRLTPPIHSRRIAEVLPDAVLTVVAGAGHMIGLERPDVVNRALRGFLRRAGSDRAVVLA